MTRQDGCRMVILGDFNAAPPGGRWGYSKWSAAAREDQTMTDWVREANLTEVFPRGKLTPTWRPSEGQQKVVLDRVLRQTTSFNEFLNRGRHSASDRVLIIHDNLASLELSVRWHCPLIVFDHALLTLQIQHSLIGTGYGGACRPGREASTRSRCRVNLRRWRG